MKKIYLLLTLGLLTGCYYPAEIVDVYPRPVSMYYSWPYSYCELGWDCYYYYGRYYNQRQPIYVYRPMPHQPINRFPVHQGARNRQPERARPRNPVQPPQSKPQVKTQPPRQQERARQPERARPTEHPTTEIVPPQ